MEVNTKELVEFAKELENIVNEFPKETKKALKKTAQKMTKHARSVAKREVKHYKHPDKYDKNGKKIVNDYHKSFKTGNVYDKDGNLCCRSYNNAPHGHLIEKGHKIIARGEGKRKGFNRRTGEGGKSIGWVNGLNVLEKTKIEYQSEFYKDMEDFLYKELKI